MRDLKQVAQRGVVREALELRGVKLVEKSLANDLPSWDAGNGCRAAGPGRSSDGLLLAEQIGASSNEVTPNSIVTAENIPKVGFIQDSEL